VVPQKRTREGVFFEIIDWWWMKSKNILKIVWSSVTLSCILRARDKKLNSYMQEIMF
jgi:hypothetical protein